MIQFDGDFENASLGQVTRLAEDWYQIGLRPDTTYWTHFRVRGCKGREITFNLTFVSRTHANRWGVRDSGNPEDPDYTCRNPYFSCDGETWHHFDDAQTYITVPNTVSFRHRFEADEVFICYTIPYTYSHLQSFLGRIAEHPLVQVESLGPTRDGHDLPIVTVGPNPDAEDVLFFVCREDGDEPTSNVALEGLIDRLIAGQDAAVTAMLDGCVLKFVPMVAIDAVVIGSPYGGPYDVMARRWLDADPLPEIAAIQSTIRELFRRRRPSLVGKLHGGQTYDNSQVWDFRIFDQTLRKLLPKQVAQPLAPDWNPYVRDAVPWVRKLTIIESWLQEEFDFWNFFSVHTNGADPDQLYRQGGHMAELLANFVRARRGEGNS
ncbi:MAG: hypothetical protein HN404_01480 [Gemmatimonadetes bacterium]|nr:hypothetical protein [Gemmatimonadota bacterium]